MTDTTPENAPERPIPIGPVVALSDQYTFEGSWELTARVHQRTLSPGDELLIEVFLTGYGPCSSAKVVAYFPSGLLGVSHNFPGQEPSDYMTEVKFGVRYVTADLTDSAGVSVRIEYPSQHEESYRRAEGELIINLDQGNFMNSVIRTQNPYELTRRRQEIEPVTGETYMGALAPLSLSAKINKKAKPGDHTVPFVLTYKTGNTIRTSTFNLDIHIVPFWERKWFQRVVSGALIIGLFAGLVTIFTNPLVIRLFDYVWHLITSI